MQLMLLINTANDLTDHTHNVFEKKKEKNKTDKKGKDKKRKKIERKKLLIS